MQHAKALVQHAVEEAIAVRVDNPARDLRSLAAEHGISYHTLWRRWRRYAAAQAAGDDAAMADASVDHRGGSNRTFSLQQEALLKDIVLAAEPAMGHQQIRDAALQIARDVGVARHAHALRDVPVFTASDGFVTAFKRRNRLSSHRTALLHVSAAEAARRDIEEESFQFVTSVRGAIDSYGAARVFNMDETPTQMCDAPTTGVVATGSKDPARVRTAFLTRHNITTFPCISAAGDKLPLCAIVKGKTARSLKKITDGASAAVGRVRLYLSQKGWMTTDIMKQWFSDVILPRTHGEPAALLLDRYGCHWTDDVVAAAEAIHLELIAVPGGATSTLQPLDVCFNGPMLKARQRIWREMKVNRPDAEDTYQLAVERSQLAYESMSKPATRAAWIRAQLVDE